MSEFKGTKGEWVFHPISEYSNGWISIDIPMGSITIYNGVYPYVFSEDKEKCIEILEANAKLIADAGTTASESGLMPSELLKQRNEMLKALKDILPLAMYFINENHPTYKKVIELIKKATE